jgi:hypothetical protein
MYMLLIFVFVLAGMGYSYFIVCRNRSDRIIETLEECEFC